MQIFKAIKTFVIKNNLIDFQTRNQKLSVVAMFINFSIAAFKVIAAFYISSYFLIVSSIYSIGIGMTKQIFYRGARNSKFDPGKERRYVILIYLALLLSSITYSIYMVRLFYIPNDQFNYGFFISLIIVIVTIIEFVFAIIGLIKSSHLRDSMLLALKVVMLSSALVSLVIAQGAMFIFIRIDIYTVYNSQTSNAILGLVVGVSSSILSIVLLTRNIKNKPKPLEELTLEELWELFPVSLLPYQKRWNKRFLKEKTYLSHHLNPDAIIGIEHIGSTALSNIYSKNIIDMMIIVNDDYKLSDIALYLNKINFITMKISDKRISLNK
ncbi:MAG: GrpB family protein, partial [Acholeplasmataceae bacterium]